MAIPLPKVTFSFTSQGDPSTRWRVVKLRLREALSELYAGTLELANEDLVADPDALLGAGCELVIAREGHARRIVGVVHRVEHLGTTAGHLVCRVHVVPALYALGQRTDAFIFQDMTVPQVLAVVFAEGLQPWNRAWRSELQRAYPTREYCVQYRETDLEFALRLMAEESISFHFDHAGTEEVLVLTDANEPFQPVTTMDGSPVAIMGPEGGTAPVETVRHFDLAHQLQTTSAVVRDFDWTQPRLDLTREARAQDARGMDREAYEYPAPLTIGEYQKPQYTAEDGAAQARLRRETHKLHERRFVGDGYVTTFTPGYTFELAGHGRADFDAEYVVTAVEHVGHAPEELINDYASAEHAAAPERYQNTFQCVPADVPVRPSRAPRRPRVTGIQTATVVGPAGEEIYTDEHGRIKVQFHWDREGARDENSSCWIRVMQAWAGAGWGFVFIPRIGMEVVVQFLEGNPDRPLVTGCVYNGENTPPYPLPDAKTKSTIKTSSSPGGGGSNELRFEDAAGSEEVYLHAQKDFNEVVEHDHTTHVKRHQTNTVDVNHTESVGGDQCLTVTGDRTKTVKKNETTTVNKNRTETVDQNETITVHGTRTETVDKAETITLNDVRATTIAKGDTLTINQGNHVVGVAAGNDTHDVVGNKTDHVTAAYSITADGKFFVRQGSVTLTFENVATLAASANKIDINNTSGSVVWDGGKVTVQAADELVLQCGASSISLKKDGTVAINGGQAVGLGCAQSTVKLEPPGVTVSGPKVTSTAVGVHEISGALIKLN